MKNTKYILLIIGLLAIASVVYFLIQGAPFTDQIITLVCGSSLIYGYFELNKSSQ